jgi:hypothetical protein
LRTQGGDIAVKGCSVSHVVNTLRAFGLEIGEGETIFKRKQTKMVSLDGSESNITVVRGMVLGYMSLCGIPFDIVCDFAFCHRILNK